MNALRNEPRPRSRPTRVVFALLTVVPIALGLPFSAATAEEAAQPPPADVLLLQAIDARKSFAPAADIKAPTATANPGAAATSPPPSPPPPRGVDLDAQPAVPSGAKGAASSSEPSLRSSPLPHDLSPIGMFQAADIVVKAVMLGLLFASLMTWTVWLAKLIELGLGRLRLRKDMSRIAGERSLAGVVALAERRHSAVGELIAAAAHELRLSSDVAVRDGLLERVASRLGDVEAAAQRRMRTGTGILASIGATAPFIGLFGTVWGIMNSFIGISKAQTTNLAVVAPGIAEALLATAIGLVAAIPAVLFYNQIARSMAAHRGAIREAAAEVLRLVSRDLDRAGHAAPHLRAAPHKS